MGQSMAKNLTVSQEGLYPPRMILQVLYILLLFVFGTFSGKKDLRRFKTKRGLASNLNHFGP